MISQWHYAATFGKHVDICRLLGIDLWEDIIRNAAKYCHDAVERCSYLMYYYPLTPMLFQDVEFGKRFVYNNKTYIKHSHGHCLIENGDLLPMWLDEVVFV
jgi:hypothetical protein